MLGGNTCIFSSKNVQDAYFATLDAESLTLKQKCFYKSLTSKAKCLLRDFGQTFLEKFSF